MQHKRLACPTPVIFDVSRGGREHQPVFECRRRNESSLEAYRQYFSGSLYKSSALVGHRNAARFGFAHPLVPMACNIIIDGITQGARN